MANDLDELYASLSLTEKENATVSMETSRLGNVLERGENCLIMKLLIRKHYNHEACK